MKRKPLSEEHKKKISETRKDMFSKGLLNNPLTYRGGEDNPNWKGGRIVVTGYIKVLKGKKYLFEHRLVMEQSIGRRLLSDEVVHHSNGDRQDNRPENLVFLRRHEHNNRYTIRCPFCEKSFNN